jgi:hypothetical protein
MLGKDTYRQWTEAFQPGSDFEGSWDEGSKIHFVDGSKSGMASRIKENKLHSKIVIEHLGLVHDGVEDTTSAEATKWTPALETYEFETYDGGTRLNVTMQTDEEYRSMFEEMWPRALQRLKELAEQS